MAGRAVLIEPLHHEEVGDLMECIAQESNLRFYHLDPTQMPDTVFDTLASLPIHLLLHTQNFRQALDASKIN
jgi:hypothetical protein